MTETSVAEARKGKLGSFVYIATLYFATVGVLFLSGYWSSFNINILEYLTLTDILRLTAYPVASSFISLAGGVAIAGYLDAADHQRTPLTESWLIGLLRRHRNNVPFVYVLTVVLVYVLGGAEAWNFLPFLFAIPVAHHLYAKQVPDTFLSGLTPNARGVITALVATLPFLAYGQGRLAADRVLAGQSFSYVISALPGGYPAKTDMRGQPRIIGHAGDYMFFFEPVQKAIIILKTHDGDALVVKHEPTLSRESLIGTIVYALWDHLTRPPGSAK